ncbi:unnamed protein product [Lactuca saligna]|uniref:Uncharacterized protein n=1 Tax=Lactuca saligna TaxID=75948 RepID=A0AA36EBD5_LACSI|nr:unnamed protein product [Lactuca saligna]
MEATSRTHDLITHRANRHPLLIRSLLFVLTLVSFDVFDPPSFLFTFVGINYKDCTDGSVLEEGHKQVKGNMWEKICSFYMKSLLVDLIRPDDIKELCSVLVVYANEAARMLADDQRESSTLKEEPETEKVVADEPSSGAHNDDDEMGPNGSGSDGPDGSKGSPMSPGTLALMCDEQDTVFTASNSIPGGAHVPAQLPHGQVVTETYAAQEKIVLTAFQDCLNRLITFGELKETQCSSLARSDSGGQSQMENQHEQLAAGQDVRMFEECLQTSESDDEPMTKLAIIPCTVLLETLFFSKQFSKKIRFSLTVLLMGVGIATVTDLQLNMLGSVLSLLAVLTTGVPESLNSHKLDDKL